MSAGETAFELHNRIHARGESRDLAANRSLNNGANVGHSRFSFVNRDSNKCLCKECPRVPKGRLYRGKRDESMRRLDNPLSDLNKAELRDIGVRIACQYRLKSLSPLFEEAALLINDPGRSLETNETSGLDSEQEQVSPRDEEIMSWQHGQYMNSISGIEFEELTGLEYKLSEDERLSLANEDKLSFWDQPWPFRSTCYMLFVAAVVQGWNQTGVNGANICWLDSLISTASNEVQCNVNSTKYAVLSAAPFLFAPIGCWLSDPLNENLTGRRRAILFSAVLIFSSAIASAFVNRWWKLLICRAVLGIGMGGKASVVPVFLAEIAPAHLRGSLVVNWQVFDALGICFGFTTNLIVGYIADPISAWRWQVASSCIPSFALIMGIIFIPWDSPRFQMKHEEKRINRFEKKLKAANKGTQRTPSVQQRRSTADARIQEANETASLPKKIGKQAERSFGSRVWNALKFSYGPNPAFGYHSVAFDTLVLLKGNQLLAAKELVYSHCQLIIQQLSNQRNIDEDEDIDFSVESSATWIQRLEDFCSKPDLGRELLAAIVVLTGQQLTGINVLIFYSAALFAPAHLLKPTVLHEPIWLSWGIGLANVLFAFPTYWWIESRGRRWLVLSTLPLLSLLMAATAGSFASDTPEPRKGLVATLTLLFTIVYSPGMGPVPFTLSAELFPLEHRMVGMSVAVSIYFLLGGVFNFIVPIVRNRSILLGIFAITNMVAWLLAYIFIREPEFAPDNLDATIRAVSLEETYDIYQHNHGKHLRFQWRHKKDAFRTVLDFLQWKETPDTRRHYFVKWAEGET